MNLIYLYKNGKKKKFKLNKNGNKKNNNGNN